MSSRPAPWSPAAMVTASAGQSAMERVINLRCHGLTRSLKKPVMTTSPAMEQR